MLWQAETTKLFKYNEPEKSWDLVSANATLSFYDRNEDASSGGKLWYFEAADCDCKVTEDFSSEISAQRVIVTDDVGGVWALKFSSTSAQSRFVTEYQGKAFENVYGKENKQENLDKVQLLLLACALPPCYLHAVVTLECGPLQLPFSLLEYTIVFECLHNLTVLKTCFAKCPTSSCYAKCS